MTTRVGTGQYEGDAGRTTDNLQSKVEEDKQYQVILDEGKKYFETVFYDKGNQYRKAIDEYDVLINLGSGAFGKVILVRNKSTQTYHAIKILKKSHILKSKQVQHTLTEKRMLQSTNKHPFLMSLDNFAADTGNLYFILPFLNGGDLFSFLNKNRKFDEKAAKFYAAQVLMGLEYMHFLEMIYRDLKPENVMMDNLGYVKITDYGFCKRIKARTYTICGTPEYIAPELIMMKGYGLTADWWSFGIFVFELACGYVPFKDTGDHLKLYNSIIAGKFRMHPSFSRELKDLITGLLQVNITRRIGCLKLGPKEIRDHPWFREISFMTLFNKKMPPPLKPVVKEPKDLVDSSSEPARISSIDDTDYFEKLFSDF